MRIPLQRFPRGYKKLRISLLEVLVLIFLRTEFLITKNYNVNAVRLIIGWLKKVISIYLLLIFQMKATVQESSAFFKKSKKMDMS